MSRLTRLAFHMDDEAAANEAIALAGRADDHATGRRLLARFDREGVRLHVAELPFGLDPIRYRGIDLCWNIAVALSVGVDSARRSLHLYFAEFPTDSRVVDSLTRVEDYIRNIGTVGNPIPTDDWARPVQEAVLDVSNMIVPGLGPLVHPLNAAMAAAAAVRAVTFAAAAGDSLSALELVMGAQGYAARSVSTEGLAAWAARNTDVPHTWTDEQREYDWQDARLLQYLLGEVEGGPCQ